MPLIAFSGIDGTGKSTQIALLQDHLRTIGRSVEVFWYRPGYGGAATAVRGVVRRFRPGAMPVRAEHPKEYDARMGRKSVQLAWSVMALLDMVLAYGVTVRWKSRGRRVVLIDRWTEDAMIDFDTRFPTLGVRRWALARVVVRLCPTPGVRILLVGDETELERRLVAKNEPFPDSAETRRRRRSAYDALAGRPAGLLVIDATEPTLVVQDSILSASEAALDRSR